MTIAERLQMDGVGGLADLLREHQASLDACWLADHGWQVQISNPGGSCWVHACEYPNKWPDGEGPSLLDTIARAFAQAEAEGWL